MLRDFEILEEHKVTNTYIETPNGLCKILKVYKTIPLPTRKIITEHYSLRCSEKHLIQTPDGWKYAMQLKKGSVINTETGPESITEAFYDGVDNLYDITIDHPSGAFYSSGIISHNSTTFAARQLILTHLIPQYKSLYVCPQHDQLKTYADRYMEMESAFRVDVGKQNKYSKKYPDNCAVDMRYCLTTANSVRGMTVDECVLDECVAYDSILKCSGTNVSVDIYKKICDICVGDFVKGVSDDKEITYERVTAKQYKGKRACYELVTESGNSIRATGNHKFLTNAGWLYLDDIRRSIFHTGERLERNRCRHLSTCIESTSTRAHAWNPVGRWLHTKPGKLQKQEEINYTSLCGAERLFGFESLLTERFESEFSNRAESWLFGRFLRSAYDNKVLEGSDTLLVPVLQQAGNSTGWIRTDEEVCLARLGGYADLGSYSLVVARRWKFVGKYISVSYGVVFRRRDKQINSLVQEEWCSKQRYKINKITEKENKLSLQHHSVESYRFCGCVQKGVSVCSSVYDVQTEYRKRMSQAYLRSLWFPVFSDTCKIFFYDDPQFCVLSELQRRGRKESKTTLQRKSRSRKDSCQLERKLLEEKRKNSRSEEELLREAQRKYISKSASETSGSFSRGRDICKNRDLQLLQQTISDEFENTQIADQSGYLCLQKSGMQKEARKSSNFYIKIAEESEQGTEVAFSSIKSIKFCGYVDVYDITTEPNHNFIANNIVVHNCQGLDAGILPELLYVQTTSKIPSTVFAGTSLTIDTLLESKWQASSQGVWNVKSPDGTHWLNMHDQDTLYKVCNNPKGPTCPYTGEILDVRNGCYVHENLQSLAVGEIGIHVPQCIIPDLVYNPIRWGKIYTKIQQDEFKKVLQECFGIAVSEGSREISEKDLIRMCVLTDTEEELKQKCFTGYYRIVISGCDWGGSDYNPADKSKTSYTVHCIIGLAPDGFVDILRFKRYSGMEYGEIASDIVNAHKNFNGRVIASDFGAGMLYNSEIRNRLPEDTHFIMSYVGPEAAPIATPAKAHMHNQLSINRTESISKVFSSVKSMEPKIRARKWDDMQVYLLDFLNMYRIPTELPNGKTGFRYMRSAQKADDALHAFNFAYTMMLFYMGVPMVHDVNLEKKLRDVMAGATNERTATYQELQRRIRGETDYIVFG